MTKTPIIKVEGQEMPIPNETAQEMPITLTYTQARALAKSLRPPPSEKQKAHVQKLVEANKLKWEEKKKQKEEEQKKAQEEQQRTMTKVVVKPKRIYKTKKILPKTDEDAQYKYDDTYEDEEDDEMIEVVEQVVRRPKKKVIKKIIEESDEDDDEIIQKTKKASKLVETVNKLDTAIQQMKVSNNRYDSLLSKVKF